MPRIPRFGRPGALKIRQPPATQVTVEAPPSPTSDVGAAAPLAPADAVNDPASAPPSGAADTHIPAPNEAPALAEATSPASDVIAGGDAAEPATSVVAPARPYAAPEAAPPSPPTATPSEHPGFRERAMLRRRLRFLRSARELALRDLGGLMFELHRFGRNREDLLKGKLAVLGRIDTELRTLERALTAHEPVTVLREAGIAACRRCAAIHGSDARFCANCGLPLGRRAHVPMAAPSIAAETSAPPAETGAPATETSAPPAETGAPPAETGAAPAESHSPPAPGEAAAADTPTTAGGEDTAEKPSSLVANGVGKARAPLPPAPAADGDASEQPTRVSKALSADDSEPSTR